MEVEIISREYIRPSSPTPPHLRTFKISLLDQLTPLFYVPSVFHFPKSDGNCDIKQLKTSLSETLSRFYPLAGRIKDQVSIDCNDEGVLFIEAQVNCHISEFLKKPQTELLQRLVPTELDDTAPPNTLVQLSVQINKFACGGIAMGFCNLHRLVDACTAYAFYKCWAALATGCPDKAIYPTSITASSFFPPMEQLPEGMSLYKSRWLKEGKSIQRRFVFDSAAITALKAKAASKIVPYPSRVEVVTAFIWKRAMTASRVLTGSQRGSMLAVAVNIRPRMDPPLSDCSIGNVTWRAMVNHNAAPIDEMELQVVVGLMRETTKKVDGDFVRSLQGDEGFSRICKIEEELDDLHSREKPDMFISSSLKSFAFTDLDFGWGKPIWVSHVRGLSSPVFVNQVILAETKWGDGIEAWLLLDEKEMAILEQDPEFLSFASLNPGIQMSVAPQ